MWLDVVGWEGLYEVSDEGQVRSRGGYANCRAGGKAFRKGRVLKPLDSGRYLHVCLAAPGREKITFNIHTLVLSAFRGMREEGQECRHLDGNARNNALQNLAWGVAHENIDDREKHGKHAARVPRGEMHPHAKLTEGDVRWIRAHRGLVPRRALALKFDVSEWVISDVTRNLTWKCVK